MHSDSMLCLYGDLCVIL